MLLAWTDKERERERYSWTERERERRIIKEKDSSGQREKLLKRERGDTPGKRQRERDTPVYRKRVPTTRLYHAIGLVCSAHCIVRERERKKTRKNIYSVETQKGKVKNHVSGEKTRKP